MKPLEIVVDDKNVTNNTLKISTHETTPLPIRPSKDNPISPQAILDLYNANRDNDDLFTINEANHNEIEQDPKRLEARKSYNSVMKDLSIAADEEKKFRHISHIRIIIILILIKNIFII